mmetsp:Transcript_84452/g.167654  ORF Transcript_84452/g.167654 Transcript_84452/m.167654 type:complete len:267 (-) Transcript_84452:2748-3548(-)
MPGIPGMGIIMPCCGTMPGSKPNPGGAIGFPGMPACICVGGGPVGGGPGTGCPDAPTAVLLSGGPGIVPLLDGPVLPWLSCSSNFRIRAVSTADGLVPVTGPSATMRCCSSPGSARNMAAARWSILFSWMNTATGSGPDGGGGSTIGTPGGGGTPGTIMFGTSIGGGAGALGSPGGGCISVKPGGGMPGIIIGGIPGGGSGTPGGRPAAAAAAAAACCWCIAMAAAAAAPAALGSVPGGGGGGTIIIIIMGGIPGGMPAAAWAIMR